MNTDLSSHAQNLRSKEVDYRLYPDGHQGYEDQRSSHYLLSTFQVATQGEEYGAQGKEQHTQQYLPQQKAYQEASQEEQSRAYTEA